MWKAPDQTNNPACEMITYVSAAQTPVKKRVKINIFP